MDSVPKVELARIQATDYVTGAYSMWRRDHDGVCPAELEELTTYANKKDTRDPWGSSYVMTCATDTPFGVMSAGPDGILGTDDDIRSWDRR